MASLFVSILVATAAGLVGCFAVMRRLTLAADAVSHVALPGIGMALLLGGNPVAGALITLIAGALLIWLLERRSGLSTEAVVGVVFSVALAVGALITSGDDLIDALFGGQAVVRGWELAMGVAGSLLVSAFVLRLRGQLVVAMVSPDVARTAGIAVDRLELGFLLAFVLTVALGLRYLGVLLMGSLLIVPAVTARNMARSLSSMLAISVVVAVVAMVTGVVAGDALHRPSGPLVICAAALLFGLSFLMRRR